FQGRHGPGYAGPGLFPGSRVATAVAAEGAARPGNHLPDVFGEGAGPALPVGGGTGRGPVPVPGGAADYGAAGGGVGAGLEVGAASASGGGAGGASGHGVAGTGGWTGGVVVRRPAGYGKATRRGERAASGASSGGVAPAALLPRRGLGPRRVAGQPDRR